MNRSPENKPCKVYITRMRDGACRVYETMWDIKEGSTYLWEEGNYRCDCNRHLFWQYANGVSVQEATEKPHPCTEGAYRIDKIELLDGSIVYSEKQ